MSIFAMRQSLLPRRVQSVQHTNYSRLQKNPHRQPAPKTVRELVQYHPSRLRSALEQYRRRDARQLRGDSARRVR